MSAASTTSSDFMLSLPLSEGERVELLNFLEQALRDTLVEVHRTESPDFREMVQRKEAVLRKLIDGLRRL